MKTFIRMLKDNSGAAAAEYALILAIVGAGIAAAAFALGEDIAKELSGEVVFPTYFDAVLRLRKVLQDASQSIGGIASAVALEPLISAKLLQLANSVAFNPAGREVLDLKSAIARLGINAVRTAAISIWSVIVAPETS